MKAYRNTTLSKEQFAKLKAFVDECQRYMDDPEFQEREVESGMLWWKRKFKTYKAINMPMGISCGWGGLASEDKELVKSYLKPNRLGLKMFALYQMFNGGKAEVMIDDELYASLSIVVGGKE